MKIKFSRWDGELGPGWKVEEYQATGPETVQGDGMTVEGGIGIRCDHPEVLAVMRQMQLRYGQVHWLTTPLDQIRAEILEMMAHPLEIEDEEIVIDLDPAPTA